MMTTQSITFNLYTSGIGCRLRRKWSRSDSPLLLHCNDAGNTYNTLVNTTTSCNYYCDNYYSQLISIIGITQIPTRIYGWCVPHLQQSILTSLNETPSSRTLKHRGRARVFFNFNSLPLVSLWKRQGSTHTLPRGCTSCLYLKHDKHEFVLTRTCATHVPSTNN